MDEKKAKELYNKMLGALEAILPLEEAFHSVETHRFIAVTALAIAKEARLKTYDPGYMLGKIQRLAGNWGYLVASPEQVFEVNLDDGTLYDKVTVLIYAKGGFMLDSHESSTKADALKWLAKQEWVANRRISIEVD